MKWIFFFIFSLFQAQSTLPFQFYAKVIVISDADTFKVLYNGNQEVKVRLNHIDAPERGQDFGKKAKEFASQLSFGKQVKIVWQKKDRYGRILAEIFVNDKNVNRELVKQGYAWHFKKYSKSIFYASLENFARKNKKGLWQQPNPTPPWEWRKKKKAVPK